MEILHRNIEKVDAFRFIKLMGSLKYFFEAGQYAVFSLSKFYSEAPSPLSDSLILVTKDENLVFEYFQNCLHCLEYTQDDLINWCYFLTDKNGIDLSRRVASGQLENKIIIKIVDELARFFTKLWLMDCNIIEYKDEYAVEYAKKNPTMASRIYLMQYADKK